MHALGPRQCLSMITYNPSGQLHRDPHRHLLSARERAGSGCALNNKARVLRIKWGPL